MESMGIALVWCMLQVTLLVVLAGIVYLIVRRYVPAAGALVTAATIGAVVVVSALAFSPWPRWQLATVEQATPVAIEESEPVAPANHEPASSTPLETPIAEIEPVAAEFDWALMLQALGEQLRVEPIIETEQPRRWPTYLAIGLILITCVGITRLLLGLASMRKFRRLSRAVDDSNINELVDVLRAELGYARSIGLRELASITTAATIGWRRPLILLPSEWTDWNATQRRAVLAHEIAHVRSGDYLVHLLAQISLVFHFYHPLVHWLVARLRLEQELAADALAARLAGGQTAYLKTLAEMALRQSDESLGWPARTFLPTRGTFLRRIEMLRDSKSLLTTAPKSARWLSAGSILMIGLLAVGIRGPGVETVVAAPQQLADGLDLETPQRLTDFLPRDPLTEKELKAEAEALKAKSEAELKKLKTVADLRDIGLALKGYYLSHGNLPPSVLFGPDGKTPHSWRVAVLPFMNQKKLHQQYRFNEPWDSEHNEQLISKIPDVFQHPNDNRPRGNTGYFAIVGKGTMFPGKGKKIRYSDILDGISNAIAVFEARRDIPWTKPEDIPYSAKKRLPKFGGFRKESFHMLLPDGSVHEVKQNVDDDILRPYITISDRKQTKPLPLIVDGK